MQRGKNKHDYISYKYEFPGGKIEDGESKTEALIRELKEEMKSGDRDDYVTLITRLKQLQEMKKVLAKELGERIVLKY